MLLSPNMIGPDGGRGRGCLGHDWLAPMGALLLGMMYMCGHARGSRCWGQHALLKGSPSQLHAYCVDICTKHSGLHTCRPFGPHSARWGAPRRAAHRHGGTQAAAGGSCPPLLHPLATPRSLPDCLRLPACSTWGRSSDKTPDKQ